MEPNAKVVYPVKLLPSMKSVTSWHRSRFWSTLSWIHFKDCGYVGFVKLLPFPEEGIWNGLVCVSHTFPGFDKLFHSLLPACLVKQADLQKEGSSVQTLHNPFIFLKYSWSGLVWKVFVCIRAISQLHKSSCHRERTGNDLSTLQIPDWLMQL